MAYESNPLMEFAAATGGPQVYSEFQTQQNALQQNALAQQAIQQALASGEKDPSALLLAASKANPEFLKSYANYQSEAPYRALQAALLGNQLGNSTISTSPGSASPNLNRMAGGGSPSSPSIAEPVATARTPLYKGNAPFTEGAGDGYQWALDSTGARVQIPIPGGDIERGKQRFETILGKMAEDYKKLEANGGLRSTKDSALNSAAKRLAGSWLGQQFGSAFSTENQTLRDNIESDKSLLKQEYVAAKGIKAGTMNSDKEAENLEKGLSKATTTIESVNNALGNLSQNTGTGKVANDLKQPAQTPAKQAAPITATGPNGQKIMLINGQWVAAK